MNTDKRKSRKSIFLLTEFERFVDWFRPGFVLIENVPGLQSKKRPAILPQFKKFLRQRDYAIAHGVINAVDYGVPQKRKRYLLIATRLTKRIEMPAPSGTKLHVRDRIGTHNGFAQIKAGHSDNTMFRHSAAALSPMNQQRISRTPVDGGTRASWRGDAELQIPAYKGKDRNFTDVYGRMFWDKPAPTITTRFNSLSNGRFGHPQENRAISLREGAVLQSFPKRYVFRGGNAAEIARQIGNAVPPALARRVGTHLLRVFRDSQKVARD
jgi:DNA (cytosine-5)-methyltransferase 1